MRRAAVYASPRGERGRDGSIEDALAISRQTAGRIPAATSQARLTARRLLLPERACRSRLDSLGHAVEDTRRDLAGVGKRSSPSPSGPALSPGLAVVDGCCSRRRQSPITAFSSSTHRLDLDRLGLRRRAPGTLTVSESPGCSCATSAPGDVRVSRPPARRRSPPSPRAWRPALRRCRPRARFRWCALTVGLIRTPPRTRTGQAS